ncbi:MAG TPA: ABC transporter ATP-binding protein, partial [Armatimonadetes bacterium]|nr:ABC transporter ATP-binding protein [Armatimonadota bacterium]
IGILAFLFTMNWRLTLLILLPAPVILISSAWFWRIIHPYFHRWWHRWSQFSARLNESLSGIKVVKAFAQEDREIAMFDKRNEELLYAGIEADRRWFVFYATLGFMTSLGVYIAWLGGGAQVISGELTLGTLMAFISYLWLFYGPLQWMSQVNTWMTRAFTGAERIFEVIDTPSEPYDAPDAIPMPRIEGRIEFKDVSFGYDPAKPVLKDINLVIEPGEMIGLVGRSGAGKSTLINLICRFYDVTHGCIEIDGVDIRKIKLSDLREQIGVVLQDPFLFDGTIAENIAYGKPDATFDEIVEAARIANAHEFIVALPDGYNTRVGERGSRLSGGERQRIAIARAILHNPRILILDEATSSVDTETEKKIQEAIA